jgi:hypothetical protein
MTSPGAKIFFGGIGSFGIVLVSGVIILVSNVFNRVANKLICLASFYHYGNCISCWRIRRRLCSSNIVVPLSRWNAALVGVLVSALTG